MLRGAKAKVEKQLLEILALVRETQSGVSREALGEVYLARFGAKISSRTFQRRLEELIVRQAIRAEGDSTSTVYIVRVAEAIEAGGQEPGYVRLSAQGTAVRDLVRRPIIDRPPVGYNADWLHDYKPGRTWYLSKVIRTHLRELGQTPDVGRPAGTYAREVLGRLLIDLSWASSRLEGNTYSRLDTQNLLEFGQRAEGKDAEETQMILNHKAAIEYLVSDSEQLGINRPTLLTLHAALAENLVGDPADEGRLRERAVNITGTTYTPIAIPQVIRECFDRLVESAVQIPDPFEQAFFFMVHIPYLQPFADVNKRTSRLAANLPLIAGNLRPLSFVDVPEQPYVEGTIGVYELQRTELLRDVFVWAYERSCAQYRVVRDSLGVPDPLRLRYRSELAQAVAESVRAGTAPRLAMLKDWGTAHAIAASDVDAFAERALALLVTLNEGSAGRYRLRPSEFRDWKERFQPSKPTGRSTG